MMPSEESLALGAPHEVAAYAVKYQPLRGGSAVERHALGNRVLLDQHRHVPVLWDVGEHDVVLSQRKRMHVRHLGARNLVLANELPVERATTMHWADLHDVDVAEWTKLLRVVVDGAYWVRRGLRVGVVVRMATARAAVEVVSLCSVVRWVREVERANGGECVAVECVAGGHIRDGSQIVSQPLNVHVHVVCVAHSLPVAVAAGVLLRCHEFDPLHTESPLTGVHGVEGGLQASHPFHSVPLKSIARTKRHRTRRK
mmetsp:Transcript_1845/g.6588  ORF Transcript_1845/g.6588 Transcript_1845/m.6588 type:complete len:256 (-) Transcript_1845:466-1233(-)